MNQEQILETVGGLKLVPVVVIHDADDAVPLARALVAGGCPVIEITFRTPAAAEAIRRIRDAVPEMLIGAGTLLTPDQVATAQESGAVFGIAPGFDPVVVAAAQERGFTFVPGVATASEMAQALTMGCGVQKFFPAEATGGIALLKGLMAAFGHTGLQIIPTGGVSAENIVNWLSVNGVVACGGTWICDANAIANKRWADITSNTQEALANIKYLYNRLNK